MNAQEGKTKAMRQWRFGPGEKIPKPTVLRYMREAMKLVDDGKEIKPEKNKALEIPTELQQALAGNKALQQAFGSLSLSHKREYADYIAEAKQTITRERRLKKITGMILKRPDFTTTTGNEIFIYQNCSCHTYCFVFVAGSVARKMAVAIRSA